MARVRTPISRMLRRVITSVPVPRHEHTDDADHYSANGGPKSPFCIPVCGRPPTFRFLLLFSQPSEGVLTLWFVKTSMPHIDDTVDCFTPHIFKLLTPLCFLFGAVFAHVAQG